MNQLNSLSNSAIKYNGLSIKTIHSSTQKPNKLVRSVVLLHLQHLPNYEAICRVRDLATGEIRQVLASKLLPISYGKDTYLLELLSDMGRE